MTIHTISIIGSFRHHYPAVLDAIDVFENAGLKILSPVRSKIVDPGEKFVRFHSDPPFSDDADIQDRAFANMFRSDAIYVVAPRGYIGRTTCLEIGRLLDRDVPLYFSNLPDDIPIRIGPDQICSPVELVSRWRITDLLAGDPNCISAAPAGELHISGQNIVAAS